MDGEILFQVERSFIGKEVTLDETLPCPRLGMVELAGLTLARFSPENRETCTEVLFTEGPISFLAIIDMFQMPGFVLSILHALFDLIIKTTLEGRCATVYRNPESSVTCSGSPSQEGPKLRVAQFLPKAIQLPPPLQGTVV